MFRLKIYVKLILCHRLWCNNVWICQSKKIFNQAIKINFSTKIVLLSAGLSLFLSIYLFFFMQSEDAKLYGIFVGLWVPSILSAYRVIESSVSASEIDQEDEPEINETKWV